MLITVFLVWETTLIKFKSSFSPKARNNLPIIDRIIEDTDAFIDFSPKFERKKFQRVLETLGIQSLSFQDDSCYEKNNAKEAIDEMQSAVNRGY